MGRHRIDETGSDRRWGGPALTARAGGLRRDVRARHARPDDEPHTEPLEGALRGEVVAAP